MYKIESLAKLRQNSQETPNMTAKRNGRKHFTASGLIENQGQFLVLYHKKLELWLYPGGHLETNKEPHEALIREIDEETRLKVDLISNNTIAHIPLQLNDSNVAELPLPLTILCEKIPEKHGKFHWHIDLIYLCQTSNEQRNLLADQTGFKWVTPVEAERINCPKELSALMRRALKTLETNSSNFN